eukprot:907011-Karenia_brevis.AAC.1
MCGLEATAGHAPPSISKQSYSDHASPAHIDAIVHDMQSGEGAPAIVECGLGATAGHAYETDVYEALQQISGFSWADRWHFEFVDHIA